MWKKKNIVRVGLPVVTITALLGEAMFNQDLKREYGMLPDPPQIQVEIVGPNPIIEEATGATGVSGSGINIGPTGPNEPYNP